MSDRRSLALIGISAIALAAPLAFLSAAEEKKYTYDTRGRLVVQKSTGDVNNNQTHTICYDRAGNRTLYDSHSTGTPASCPTPSPTPSPT